MMNVVEMQNWYFVHLLVVLFPLLFDITQGDGSIWQLTYVPKANFTNSRYGKVSAFQSHSDLTCIMAASRMFWPQLACFVNGFCLMTKYQTVPRSNSAGITDPVECMTHFRENDCDFENGTVVNEGTSWSFYCGNKTCYGGQIIDSFARQRSQTINPSTCTMPFSNFPGLGCVQLLQTERNACDSKQACYSQGAKLAKIDDTTNRTALTLFATQKANGKEFWVGLEYIKGNWTWDLGGQESPKSPIWNSEFTTKTWECAYAKSSSGNTFALQSSDKCKDDKYYALCEVPF